ncbi:DegT/DnrJ/EryC1/StrS family aminotransferase [Actinopolymorpha pittospori]|uniref:dTDP-4-amino-4,6-dideoxygalactose transaminase n=1 Tax=Actinopolymorpha pittospori TaxID=648752 RepID=A0A927NDB4_9ACTN|nr:DegT/DnrJ/EryC1/StrS family aminotransferase [Actinopolymorpha pittospori]MBE1612760.1 dTDP-4-amino-4,6-dideoxygalactose transaminase [Actinopolymorpha pittospori]
MSTGAIPAAKPMIGDEERRAVDRVLASGMVVQGPEVAAFEEEFSALVEGRPCVAVNSGTSALHLGLLAAGVGPGDEVIVPSFTFAATANSVALTGATPVFADIEPDHFCLDPVAVEAAVSPRTVGIMPVHLYGHAADMTALQAIADRHGLALFEDACQAHLASWHGRPVGALGTIGTFSFYPTKNMTTGEGGLVVCADEEIARKVRLLRNQGMERRYENELVGFNTRMTDIAAAIGRVQLTKVGAWTERRQANASYLDTHLTGVATPKVAGGAVHVYHQYTVRAHGRDALQARLSEAGIGTGVYYPIPNHRLPSFADGAGRGVDLPETERACREAISLPVHPALTDNDLERIVAAVTKAVEA